MLGVIDLSIHLINPGNKSFIFNEAIGYFEDGGFDHKNGPLVSSLKEIDSSLKGFILYNDVPPLMKEYEKSLGNGRGLVYWNTKYVWWVIHSVPNWPIELNPLSELDSSVLLDSHIMVILKIDIKNINSVIHQLLVNNVCIYSFKNIDFLDHCKLLLKRSVRWKFLSGDVSIFTMESMIPNMQIIHYAKTHIYKKDLYDDLICSTLNIKKKHKEWNLFINNEEEPWSFIGMKSEKDKGEGIIAIKNPVIWKTLRKFQK